MITDEDREMVQVACDHGFDAKMQKAADALGVPKEKLVQQLIENSIVNAMYADDGTGKRRLTLYSQEEWTGYVTSQCYKLYESGEINQLKKDAEEMLSKGIH